MPTLSLPASEPAAMLLAPQPLPAPAPTPCIDLVKLAGVPHLPNGASNAFAFFPPPPSELPGSTWQQTQTLGGMPTGRCGHGPAARQQLCLLPQPAPGPARRIVYLVASCRHSHAQTVPPLLAQLLAAGIGPSQIKVVVQGSGRNEDREIEGVSYAFSTHRAGEWTTLYEAPLRWQFDYGMLLPATSELPPGFRRKVECINTFQPWGHRPAASGARGPYSHDFLSRLNPWLESLDGIDPKNSTLAEATAEMTTLLSRMP